MSNIILKSCTFHVLAQYYQYSMVFTYFINTAGVNKIICQSISERRIINN